MNVKVERGGGQEKSGRQPPQRFQRGGSLQQDAVYAERPADRELYDALLARQFAYVLAPRQIGKTSLRNHTARRLSQVGILCAEVDLSGIGTVDVDASQWYCSLIDVIAQALSLPDLASFWGSTSTYSPVHRFSLFLHNEVLLKLNQPIVVFLDEIDSTLRLPLDPGDFFAAIRSLYNARSSNRLFERLTFCMLGVSTPMELINDPRRTPFNIGQPILLEDFDIEEAAQAFVPALNGIVDNPRHWLETIFEYTDGHPFMTHKLCGALADNPPLGTAQETIPQLVDRLFLQQGRIAEACLSNAEQRFESSNRTPGQLGRMLRLHRQLLRGVMVPSIGDDQTQMELRLAGMAADRLRGAQRTLQIRNRIFATVFDEAWVHERESRSLFFDSFERWQTQERHADYLLKGQPLAEAVSWANGRDDVQPEEHEFLEAGLEAARQEQESQRLAAQARHDQELRQRSESQARLYRLVALVLLAAFAVLLWMYSETQRSRVRERLSRLLAIAATASEAQDPSVAHLLMREVIRRLPAGEPPSEVLRVARSLVGRRVPIQVFRGPPFGVMAMHAHASEEGSAVDAIYKNGELWRWPVSGLPPTLPIARSNSSEQNVANALFSPDGRWVATLLERDDSAIVQSPETFQDEIRLLHTDGRRTPVKVSVHHCIKLTLGFRVQDDLLLAGCSDGTLYGWHLDGKPAFRRRAGQFLTNQLKLSPNGDYVISIEKTINDSLTGRLYALSAQGELTQLRNLSGSSKNRFLGAGFDANGRRMALAYEHAATIYPLGQSGPPKNCQIEIDATSAELVTPSPDGTLLTMRNRDPGSGDIYDCSQSWRSRLDSVFGEVLYLDRPLGTTSGQTIGYALQHPTSLQRLHSMRQADTNKPQALLSPWETSPVAMAGMIAAPDGRWLAANLQDGSIQLWQTQDATELVAAPGTPMVWDAGIRHLAMARLDSTLSPEREVFEVWDLDRGFVSPRSADCIGPDEHVVSVHLSRDGRSLVGVVKSDAFRIAIRANDCKRIQLDNEQSTDRLFVHSSGNQFVVLRHDSSVAVYDFRTPDSLVERGNFDSLMQIPGSYTDADWTKDEDSLLFYGAKAPPILLPLNGSLPIRSLLGDSRPVDAIAVRADGEEIFIAQQRSLLYLNRAQDYSPRRFDTLPLSGKVAQLFLSEDGKTLAVHYNDGRNIVLNPHADTCKELLLDSRGPIKRMSPSGLLIMMKNEIYPTTRKERAISISNRILFMHERLSMIDKGRDLHVLKLMRWSWPELQETFRTSTNRCLEADQRRMYSLDQSPEESERIAHACIQERALRPYRPESLDSRESPQ